MADNHSLLVDEDEDEDERAKGKTSASKFKIFDPDTRKFIDSQEEPKICASEFRFIQVADPTNKEASNSIQKQVRSHVMRKYHNERRSEVSTSHRRSIGYFPGDTTADRSPGLVVQTQGTVDVGVARRVHERGGQRSSWDISKGESSESDLDQHTRDEGLYLTSFDEQTLSQLGLYHCPSLASGLIMIHELAPPLIAKFPITPDSLRHVHFSISMVNKYSTPMTPVSQREWFATLITNKACYHASVLLSVITHALLRQEPIPLECLYHSSEAIRCIHSTLEEEEQRCQDDMIKAIATLVLVDSCVAEKKHKSIHLEGLETVLELRRKKGGVEMDESLREFVQCVDLYVSAAGNTPPRLSPKQYLLATPLNQPSISRNDPGELFWTTSIPNLPMKHHAFISPEHNIVFQHVRQISLLSPELYKGRYDPMIQQKYTKGIILVLQELHALSSTSITKGRSLDRLHTRNIHATVFHDATLLYVYFILRKLPPSSGTIVNIITRIRTSLETLSFKESWEGFSKGFLLWICLLCGAASLNGGREQMCEWWVGILQRLRVAMNWISERGKDGEGNEWRVVREVVQFMPWVEYLCEPFCGRFWGFAVRSRQQKDDKEGEDF